MYTYLATIENAFISEEDFIEKNQNIYEGIEVSNLTVNARKPAVGEDGSIAVDYTCSMDTAAGAISFANQARFIKNDDGSHSLIWKPSLIFPALEGNRRVRVNVLKATRGTIYDRFGEVVAGPGTASSVGFVPGKMTGGAGRAKPSPSAVPEEPAAFDSEFQDAGEANPEIFESSAPQDSEASKTPDPEAVQREADIAKVAELLEMSVESIHKKLNASYVKDGTFVELRKISGDDADLEEELLRVPGILINTASVRFYPLAEKAAHLVGYVQAISAEELEELSGEGYHINSVIGKTGLEQIYENKLRAIDGVEILIVEEDGTFVQTLAKTDLKNGEDIMLAISSALQSKLYDQFEADKACSVAMHPRTGEILALVSTPSYNSNDFVIGMLSSKWEALNEDEARPMHNRFRAALSPGSTMKAITAAIGLETGIISPDDDFGRSGRIWQNDSSWGGYNVTTLTEYNGPANIENALTYSDNIFFAKAALLIGSDTFAKELVKLGFEEKIPFDFGLYSSIISSTETFTSDIQLADSGFGQGQILVNPIHLASIYASFVNYGTILEPRLTPSENPVIWKENAFSADTAGIILNGLKRVIELGTGKESRIPGVELAGKTGTAEIKLSKGDADGTELGWFVAMTSDPNSPNQLLIASMVEDVKERGGSHYVITKVRPVLEEWLMNAN
jgi:penicillin-binding protein